MEFLNLMHQPGAEQSDQVAQRDRATATAMDGWMEGSVGHAPPCGGTLFATCYDLMYLSI